MDVPVMVVAIALGLVLTIIGFAEDGPKSYIAVVLGAAFLTIGVLDAVGELP
jgi:hypothetical protein